MVIVIKSQSKNYLESNHASAFKSGDKSAPNCITCHKSPITKSAFGDNKVEMKKAQEKLCLSCHLDDKDVKKRITPSAGFIHAYDKSVHGYALHVKNNGDAASCIDCHTAHQIIKGTDSKSSVYRLNIPNTCGKCHSNIEKEYDRKYTWTACNERKWRFTLLYKLSW